MTILVIGATGRLGSRFVPRLLRQEQSVRVLARDPARAESLERLGAEVAIGDLRDADSVEGALKSAEAVVHLVHHADAGQALLRTVQADGIDGQIFNVAAEAASRTLDDPWEGIADTAKIRRKLGFRPVYPTVYTAEDAGAL